MPSKQGWAVGWWVCCQRVRGHQDALAEHGAEADGFSLQPLQMQYVFIYQALLEHYLYGDTELEVTSLEIHLQKIYNKVPGTSSNGLEEEFKVSVVLVLVDPVGWWWAAGTTMHLPPAGWL